MQKNCYNRESSRERAWFQCCFQLYHSLLQLHKILALAREGVCQGDIATRVDVARKPINRILLWQGATSCLGPGRSTVAPRKTTAHQECILFREVKSALALSEMMGNLYGVLVGCKTINNLLEARGYRYCRILRKPLLTANHCRLRLDWAQRWQNFTVAVIPTHVIWEDESRFQL